MSLRDHLIVISLRCPSLRPSHGEWARLIRFAEGKLACTIFVFQPEGTTSDWRETDLVASADALSNTKAVIDERGTFAAALNIATSGSVVL